ncbi:MAG: hypothetical protein HZA94_01245 [Candidatus Vogelbacteria bacterium]|nr:hypothetical protein [Candidatus Vogelbacteria bacterium]
MFKLSRLAFLALPILHRCIRRGDDEEDPGFKEKVKDLIKIYFLTKGVDLGVSLLKAYVKERVIRLGDNIKIKPRTCEEITSRLKPDFVSEDFQSRAIVRTTKRPDVGNYVLVSCRTSVSIVVIFLLSRYMGWKWTTPEEAVSVYETKPRSDSFYASRVVCLGTLFRRPSCLSAISFAVTAFSFAKDEKDKDDDKRIALVDVDEEFEEDCSFLFRLK